MKLITPKDVCELVPGMSENRLAQLRYLGKGPKFYKPTPRLVLYKESDVQEWVEQSVAHITS